MKTTLALLATLLTLGVPALAQERTAGGPLQNEASWAALKNLTEQANANAKTAHIRLDQMALCGNKSMFYAPDAEDADTDGCKPGQSQDTLVFIPATNRYYQHSGVSAKKGQTVTLKATGKIAFARTANYPYYGASDRPSTTGQKYHKYNPLCPLRIVMSATPVHADVYDYAGTSLCAEEHMTFKAPASGDIYLGIPEGGSNSGDNDGGFTVSVRVTE